jgi:homoserine O-acetyltransferase
VKRGPAARSAVLALALALVFARESSSAIPAATEGDFTIHDFVFSTGERLPELRLHYRALGAPRRDAGGIVRNAVLVLHGTTGTGKQFMSENFAGVLFGPGQPLDAATHFLVLPDGIGHGGSSKPSDGLHARFPRYTYEDMITAQYRLLTEGLGVNHLRLVIGTSMGGMHTWMWGERYPDFMDALLPLASVPTPIAGRNRMLRKMIIDDIRSDPGWNGGDYAEQPRGLRAAVQVLLFMVSSPLQWQKSAPTRDAADRFLDEQMKARSAGVDANDFLYAFEASREYDPSKDLARISAPLVAINSADDQINPPELGLMEALIPRVRRGRYVLIPTSDRTRGHGTHSFPEIWKAELERLLAESAPAR